MNEENGDLDKEETHKDDTSFNKIRDKMEDLFSDGTIKKRILREGLGELIPDKSNVAVYYNAYLEHSSEPYDTWYTREKPFVLKLNEFVCIPGLNICIRSMKLNEKAQFLVKLEYGFGCLNSSKYVPPSTTMLYEVEVMHYCPSISYSWRYPFSQISAQIDRMYSEGRNSENIEDALKTYDAAVTKLELCLVASNSEREQKEKLLVVLLTNLSEAYFLTEKTRLCCNTCDRVYYLCKRSSLHVPFKVFSYHSYALTALHNRELADNKMIQAIYR